MRLSTRTMLSAVIFAVAMLSACGDYGNAHQDADTTPVEVAVVSEGTPAPEGVKVPRGILHCPVCLEIDLGQVGKTKEWATDSSSRKYWNTEGKLIYKSQSEVHQWTNYRCVNEHLFYASCNITDPVCIVYLGSWNNR